MNRETMISYKLQRLMNGQTASPPTGKKWKLLCGFLSHINTSLSLCLIQQKLGVLKVKGVIAFVGTDISTIYHSLPCYENKETIGAADHVYGYSPNSEFTILDDDEVTFSGAATSYVNLMFEESTVLCGADKK